MGLQQGVSALKHMTSPGVLGIYTHVEVTEIIAFIGQGVPPINVLTVMVAERRIEQPSAEVVFLNPSRIALLGLKNWRFGVCRYVIPIDKAIDLVECLELDGKWTASGNSLTFGSLTPRAPQFVPPDQARHLPLNRILKNNFWNGSYVAEWADLSKASLKPLLNDPRLLRMLSDEVSKLVPLHFSSLSDRLGNVVYQLPVTSLMASFSGSREGGFKVDVAWHEDAKVRPLHATVNVEFDDVVTGHMMCEVSEGVTDLPTPTRPGQYRAYLWDSESKLLLAATGEAGFISGVNFAAHAMESEPRIFKIKAEDGSLLEQRIMVQTSVQSKVTAPEGGMVDDWTGKRIYREETSRLVKERRFIQYRPNPNAKHAEHQKALKDVRQLIAIHGVQGAWLWDPYLTADDILKTLFFSPHAGSDLRGLTSMKEAPGEDQAARSKDSYFTRQRQAFTAALGNQYGLRIEYRAKSGSAGWSFHDRFLIFPRAEEGALAWSLGTSVNSLGYAHHILQRVDDGQQVSDAFLDLWERLNAQDHIIFKAGIA